MDKEDVLLEMIRTQSSDLSQVKDDIQEIKIILTNNTASLVEHVKRTNLLESEVRDLRKLEENCPGRKAADWNSTLVDKLKDIALILGFIVAILKLFKVFE